MIAIFIGVLELVKVRRLIIDTDGDDEGYTHGINTKFILNTDESTILKDEDTNLNE